MIWIHRYIGLALGLWLMAVGLTGTMLVFYKEIDIALYSQYWSIAYQPAQVDLDALLTTLRAKYPDRAILFYERYGLSDYESYPFVLSAPLAMTPNGPDVSTILDINEAADLEVFMDPQSGTMLGERPYWTWIRLIRSFHQEILIPNTGERIVGCLGFVLILTVLAGVVLWWRESKKKLRRALRLSFSSPMPRLIRDIHTVGGIYIAVFLMFQALSGATVANWFPVTQWITKTFAAKPALPASPSPAVPPPSGQISANEARDIGVAQHQASDAIQIVFPLPSKNSYSVRIYPRDEPVTRHLRQTMISASTGRVIFRFDPDSILMPSRIPMAWMIWIHNGQFFGMPGRLVVLVTGLMLTIFFPTGVFLWARQRKSRQAMALRKASAAAV